MTHGQLALVTGGGGFLGGAIVSGLLARGWRVRSISRGAYPDLESRGVECLRADLSDAAAVRRACEGCDAVFHVAALAGVWGPRERYFRANVVGTRSVLEGCRAAGVARLVHTSTPSIVFDGRDMENADESVPVARSFHSHYSETKAIAEAEVLAANSPGLRTVALRPHLIWGPGDQHILPRLYNRARMGRLARIGPGTNRVDAVYVDNAAEAHILAEGALRTANSPAAGRAYFITNAEPVSLWEFIDRLLDCCGLPPVRRSVSVGTALAVAGAIEGVYRLLRVDREPPMTRFVAAEMATSHWFNPTRAREDLGYVPRISMDEGVRRLREWLVQHPMGTSPHR